MQTQETKRYTARDAVKPLTIRIKPEHVTNAVQCNGKSCVVAEAMKEQIGEFFDGFEVGTTITKLIMLDGTIVRYATPSKLAPYIRVFDKTGEWGLPEGDYTFLPPSKTAKLGGRPSRWHKHRTNTERSGQDRFKARAVPTRRVSRVQSFCTVDPVGDLLAAKRLDPPCRRRKEARLTPRLFFLYDWYRVCNMQDRYHTAQQNELRSTHRLTGERYQTRRAPERKREGTLTPRWGEPSPSTDGENSKG